VTALLDSVSGRRLNGSGWAQSTSGPRLNQGADVKYMVLNMFVGPGSFDATPGNGRRSSKRAGSERTVLRPSAHSAVSSWSRPRQLTGQAPSMAEPMLAGRPNSHMGTRDIQPMA